MADPIQHKGASKTARIPIKIVPQPRMRLPSWIRAKAPSLPNVGRLKGILREARLHTVCEEASCPNLGECFGHGTATFMILGDLCTRRCPFCDVGHGTPLPPDADEPRHLAETIATGRRKRSTVWRTQIALFKFPTCIPRVFLILPVRPPLSSGGQDPSGRTDMSIRGRRAEQGRRVNSYTGR